MTTACLVTACSITALLVEPVRAADGRGNHDRNDDRENDIDFHIQHLLLMQDNAR